MQSTAAALALGAAFLWGSAQVIGKIALRDLNATAFNAIRFSAVTIALAPFAFAAGLGTLGTEIAILAVLSGILGFFIANQVYFHCLKKAPAHRIIPVGNTTPVWAVLTAPLLIGEQVNVVLPFSIALVVAGSFMLVPKKVDHYYWKPAAALALGSAFIFGLHEVMRKSAINVGANYLVFLWISVASAAVATSLMLFISGAWRGQRFNRTSVGLSITSGILAHFIGNVFFMLALGLEQVTNLAPFVSAVIPLGFLLSILIVREKPTRMAFAGMAVVFLGVGLVALF
ncbi:MAG: DMT family transporter [Candidatus Hadarchaeota archaeon]